MAKWIKTTGEVTEVTPENGKYFNIRELQAFVNGYFEFVNISDNEILVVNEEGLLRHLPKNQEIMDAYGIDIRGDALLANYEEAGGDEEEDEDLYFDEYPSEPYPEISK